MSGSTIPTLLQLVRDGRIEAEKLGTHRFALDDIRRPTTSSPRPASTTR